MSKQKIILFSRELPNCPRWDTILNSEYDILNTNTEKGFFSYINNAPADAAIICFCSAREEDVENVLRFEAFTGPVPMLTCSKSLNPEFIRKAAQRGADRFLICNMEVQEIKDTINQAIRDGGIRKYVKERWPDSLDLSLYITKLIDEIAHIFPHRITVRKLAERLEIDRGWLHKLCKEAFGISPTFLLRHIRVHQALRMMEHTNLDNTEIAMQLDYSEESSMARDFYKELGYCPRKARSKLAVQCPKEMLA